MQLFINNQSSYKPDELVELGENNENQLDSQLKSYNNSTISMKTSNINNNDSSLAQGGIGLGGEITCERTLDDCEFFDYLNYIGQWSRGLIPNSAFFTINLNELFTPEVQANVVVDKKNVKPQQGKNDPNKGEYKEDGNINLIINYLIFNIYRC